jgi:hypothetical protein
MLMTKLRDAFVRQTWIIAFVFMATLVFGHTYAAETNSTEVITEKDYAYGAPISMVKGYSFYQFKLPSFLYLDTAKNDFEDIAIYNADHQRVAFKLEQLPSTAVLKSVKFNYFPIATTQDQRYDQMQFEWQRGNQGVTAITSKKEVNNKQNIPNKINYLIDLSQYDRFYVDRLVFDWANAQQNSFVSLSIYGGNDLKNWYFITDGSLTRLNHLGNRVDKNSIDIQRMLPRYLLIMINNKNTSIKLTDIQGIVTDHIVVAPTWVSVTPIKKNIVKGEYEFDFKKPISLTALAFRDLKINSYAHITVYGRDKNTDSWSTV